MKMSQIKEIARQWGVSTAVGRSKRQIIREIQIREGFSPCFGTKAACEIACLWKEDCVAAAV